MSQRTKRLALVIGNSEYQNLLKTPNASNDAKAIRQTLKNLGFEVILGINMEMKEMIDSFLKVGDSWRDEANEIVVYYSGHGISIDGNMYLGPVDAAEINMDFIGVNFLALEMIINFLTKHRKDDKYPIVIILDCCRSTFETNKRGLDQDPLRRIRGENSVKSTNIAILYSTAEGHVASDGDNINDHSPYTQILLKNMIKDYTIDQIHTSIANSLHGDNKQTPWVYHCLHEPYKFCLLPNTGVSTKKHFYGVPRKNVKFVNRPAIIDKMEVVLNKKSSGETSILALHGLGGIGKTQLMLHYCYLCRTKYDIFWVEVDHWTTALDSFHKLAINLGLDEESAKKMDDGIIKWVCDFLEKDMEGWLLLLNNADETTIDKIFHLLPRVRGDIILTTREKVSDEIAKVINIDKMHEEEALSLLFGLEKVDSEIQEVFEHVKKATKLYILISEQWPVQLFS